MARSKAIITEDKKQTNLTHTHTHVIFTYFSFENRSVLAMTGLF
jgi:hypothetical protein